VGLAVQQGKIGINVSLGAARKDWHKSFLVQQDNLFCFMPKSA
jgi:hypothetical protein